MKVLILAGGLGTRMSEVYWATDFGRPRNDRFFVELSTLIAAVMDE